MSQTSIKPASTDASSYLLMLGRRTRRIRAQRGMSRRILSASSGVSERYLAQLEAGKGNASILLLKAIAEAMNIAIDDLVDALDERPVEYLLLRERLRAASEETLRRMNASIRTEDNAGDRQPTRVATLVDDTFSSWFRIFLCALFLRQYNSPHHRTLWSVSGDHGGCRSAADGSGNRPTSWPSAESSRISAV